MTKSVADIKRQSKGILKGNWKSSVLLTLVLGVCAVIYGALMFFINEHSPVIYIIINFILAGPLSILGIAYFRNLRFEKNKFKDYFEKVLDINIIKHSMLANIIIAVMIFILSGIVVALLLGISLVFGESILSGDVASMTFIFVALYIMLSIVSILVSINYSQVYFLIIDNPNMSAKQAMKLSRAIMKGNKWKFVWMYITFIPWYIVSVLTLFIGLLWIVPYQTQTTEVFYNEVKNDYDLSKVKTLDVNEEDDKL